MEEILGIYQLPGPLKCYEKPKTFLKISLRGFFEEGGDAKGGCQIKDPSPMHQYTSQTSVRRLVAYFYVNI